MRRRSERSTPHPTRERLLEVTLELIDECGLDGVDINEVLNRAGVTTGALYHHFRDVPHLLEEAMARRFPMGVHETFALMRQSIEEASSLEDFMHLMYQVNEQSQSPANRARRMERAHYLALAFSNESLRNVIAQQQAEITDDLADLLTEVQNRGWIRPDLNPKAVATFIQAYTLGRIIDDITDEPVDAADWNHLVMLVVTKAFRAEDSATS